MSVALPPVAVGRFSRDIAPRGQGKACRGGLWLLEQLESRQLLAGNTFIWSPPAASTEPDLYWWGNGTYWKIDTGGGNFVQQVSNPNNPPLTPGVGDTVIFDGTAQAPCWVNGAAEVAVLKINPSFVQSIAIGENVHIKVDNSAVLNGAVTGSSLANAPSIRAGKALLTRTCRESRER